MTVAGNPGVFLLILLYLYFFQPFLVLIGNLFKQKKWAILYLNTAIGLIPNFINLKILYTHYLDGYWWKDDYLYIYIAVCGILNVLIAVLSLFFQNGKFFSYWWFFFTWYIVFGSILLAFICNFILLG